METLAEYKGLKLIRKYGQYYIRFIGGQYEEIPCDLCITDQEASTIFAQPDAIKTIRDAYMKQIHWTSEYFITSALKDYFVHACELDDVAIENLSRYLDAHQRTKMKLHQTIMFRDETKTQCNKTFIDLISELSQKLCKNQYK